MQSQPQPQASSPTSGTSAKGYRRRVRLPAMPGLRLVKQDDHDPPVCRHFVEEVELGFDEDEEQKDQARELRRLAAEQGAADGSRPGPGAEADTDRESLLSAIIKVVIVIGLMAFVFYRILDELMT